jgi:hypothetical protein
VPYNAPPAGRYFTVGYPAAAEPLPIDWYWQLADVAAIASDTLVLFEKSPLRRVALETFATFTPMNERPSPHPDDPVERLEGLLVWFWSMCGPMAKKIARGRPGHTGHGLPPDFGDSPSTSRASGGARDAGAGAEVRGRNLATSS